MKKLKKLTMTLVALFAMTTGAWAGQETPLITIENTGDNASFTSGSKTFDNIATVTFSGEVYNDGGVYGWHSDSERTLTVTAAKGYTITAVRFYNDQGSGYVEEAPFQAILAYDGGLDEAITKVNGTSIGTYGVTKIEVYGYADAPAGPEVTWDATTKQATFEMPAYDVELMVEYYPGLFTLGGDAIEGGTLEVVGLTGDALPAGFEKDAEGNIYVAQGTTFTVKATPEEGYHFVCWSDDETNTNPEREITMPADGSDLSLSATFAENEYDITFSEGTNPDPEHPEWTAAPNPAKTKQTVTVTYTGTKKVIGVKAEKKAPTLIDALAKGATVVITYTWSDTNVTTFTYTNNGGYYTGNSTGVDAGNFVDDMSIAGTALLFQASNPNNTGVNVNIEFYADTNEYYFNSKGSLFTSFTISVNGTDLTSQLKEVK